ncbi:DNA helicase IV [Erwinia sp. OLTSP20]|uniref:DNA helicase IV n=1 Tax=unclassified Erwinia TaxID=2622719 RepID=UPI000C180940|nr:MULTISPECIES: DNA helicase IV [unclassified Erwinia]PIJ51358.1 DNA helicase IV [Erwinia sp. OAMSP11]PIJ74142.1 DNA helicase IV [Erwinia sp. OLSSP12]PIJ81568.1 DNA helicase IV [Erwinia sp. OLCASP19]PIJ86105.1 DNA helicase IV [Erwinia sp. OLMTSP26]PIJ87853.1 DNA helicase IV [Erwinia sp. OLMDSP33]
MELKSTSLGKHLARHPYNQVRLLNAGVEVSGEKHQYLIPFNQLLTIRCKRGVVWGELEFTLIDEKVVRLHGTEWNETQRFFHYLDKAWTRWSEEMSEVSATVLADAVRVIDDVKQQSRWLKSSDITDLRQQLDSLFSALPLPHQRLPQFANCGQQWAYCQCWYQQADEQRQQHNAQWSSRMLEEYADFFNTVESTPLNESQARAVVNGEDAVLTLAGAGSGKTSVLVARAGWLIQRKLANPEQILLLAFGRKAAEEMQQRVQQRLNKEEIDVRTFHSLALHIIQQASQRPPAISVLETDAMKRREFLVSVWRQQCAEKKAQAKGWRQWLEEELGWTLDDAAFWQDERLASRVASRLERWLGLMRTHGGAQAAMIEQAPDALRDQFSKRVRLMAPLVKAWKSALKNEGAVDFAGLIHQAVNLLDKGRFISQWKAILVDEFQDISPQRACLLAALRRQNTRTSLFAVGDDWQAIYRFSGAEMALTTAFHHHFGEGDRCILDITYRFNERIGDIANRFVQQNPHQLKKPLNSLRKGSKKAVILLPENQFEALLNKLSGFVRPQEKVLVLARYHYLRPAELDKAKTRWPGLDIEFMTIHVSKGRQADYVILLGLSQGKEGFPAVARESVIEEVLLPVPEDFPDAEERRLAYVALTRAKEQVWLLFDPQAPSVFVDEFKRLGVSVQRKP